VLLSLLYQLVRCLLGLFAVLVRSDLVGLDYSISHRRVGAENPVTLPDLGVRIIAAHAGDSLLGALWAKGRVRHGW
jgi:hypothetical protein